MESTLAKQVRYGRSCIRCRSYFVTEDERAHVCPWCEKNENRVTTAESFEPPERLDE
jgi:Zn finger protein HypA/HybF involved in hydrogenase expression